MTHDGFFVTQGGPVPHDSASYIRREADEKLYQLLLQGSYCYVLTSRQMGKSSLVARTANRLRSEEMVAVTLDLAAIGKNLTPEQWYFGLLDKIGRQVGLLAELRSFWFEHQEIGPLQRLMDALREVLLVKRSGPISIFVDEIDTVRSLKFNTDEFFAGIRELYNRRTDDPELKRLAFCLLGVATPADLIKDARITPFNIGGMIELHDFSENEVQILINGLRREVKISRQLLSRVLYWTGGHPYLTQKLCEAVAVDGNVRNKAGVDRKCEELFLSPTVEEKENNLQFVRKSLLESSADITELLSLYRKILRGEKVLNDRVDSLTSVLRLSGVTQNVNGYLRPRNRIYERVFDQGWAESWIPGAELKRERDAYKRGRNKTALIAASVLLLFSLLTTYAFALKQDADKLKEIAVRRNNELQAVNEELRREQEAKTSALAVAQKARSDAEQSQRLAEDARDDADQRRIAEEKARIDLDQALYNLSDELERNTRLLHSTNIALAQKSLEAGYWEYSVSILDQYLPNRSSKLNRSDLRDFEWLRLWHLLHPEKVTRNFVRGSPVQFSSNRRWVVKTGKWQHDLELYNFAGGELIAKSEFQRDKVISIESSSDERYLLTVDEKRTVCIWQLPELKQVSKLVLSSDKVTTFSFSTDGKYVIGGDGFSVLGLWDVATGKPVLDLEENVREVVVLPNSKIVIGSDLGEEVIGLWDIETGKAVQLEGVEKNHFELFKFSKNGMRLAAIYNDSFGLWDLETGKKIPFNGPTTESRFDLSMNGEFISIIRKSPGDEVGVWSIDTGKKLLLEDAKDILGFVFVNDNRVMGLNKDTFGIWDIKTRKRLHVEAAPVEAAISENEFDGDMSPDGKYLAIVWGSGLATCIYEVETGKRITLEGVKDVGSVAITFSLNSKVVIGTRAGFLVEMWEASTGKRIYYKGPTDLRIYEVSPNGRFVLGQGYRTAGLWETKTGKQLLFSEHHPEFMLNTARNQKDKYYIQFAFSPDGHWAAIRSDHQISYANIDEIESSYLEDAISWKAFSASHHIVAGELNGEAWLWNINSDKPFLLEKGEGISSFTFSPDQKLVAGVGKDVAGLWDTANGKNIFLLDVTLGSKLEFSSDSMRLIVVQKQEDRVWGADKVLSLWDVTTGGRIPIDDAADSAIYELSPNKMCLVGNQQKVVKDEDGNQRLIESKISFLWNVLTGKKVILQGAENIDIDIFEFSPNGSYVVGIQLYKEIETELLAKMKHKVLGLWDVATGKKIILQDTETINKIEFSPDEVHLVGVQEKRQILNYEESKLEEVIGLWNIKTGKKIVLEGDKKFNSFRFSPKGKYLAVGYRKEEDASFVSFTQGGFSGVWEVETGKKVLFGELENFDIHSNVFLFSPNEQHIVTGFADEIAAWNIATGKKVPLGKISRGKTIYSWGENQEFPDFKFSSDGRLVLVGWRSSYFFQLWDVVTGVTVLLESNGSVPLPDFSSDGKSLLGYFRGGTVWNIMTGIKEIDVRIDAKRHKGDIKVTRFSPNKRRLITGGEDGDVIIWDTIEGKELMTLKGHQSEIEDLILLKNGAWIASKDGGGVWKIWKSATWQEVRNQCDCDNPLQ